ncbi:MAG: hypothetical protein QXZ22_08060 [Sulfolobales archaeon]
MKARYAYFWLKIVEITSIPLSVLLAIFILSGYGTLFPEFMRLFGFNYRVSTYLHTHPILRYLTTVLVAIHGYGGFALLINRYSRNPLLRSVLQALAVIYASLLVLIPTLAELLMLFSK